MLSWAVLGKILRKLVSRTTSLLVFTCLLYSCASMHSGQYVRWGKGDSWETLAKKYETPLWALKSANEKNLGGRAPASGDWVFVPQRRGFMGQNFNYGALSGNETEEIMSSGEFAWPVPASKRVSSPFGSRWGRHHDGIDIAAREGASIVAASDGVVVYSGSQIGGYGNITVLAHRDGFFTVYAHAQKNYTKKGERVHRGQVIAKVGQTGRSTGPHLHFEIRHDSKPINPKSFYAFK